MPTLQNVADVLRQYGGRYEFLDAFADDVDELRTGVLAGMHGTQGDPAAVTISTNAGRIVMQLFPDQGIARFCLADQAVPQGKAPVAAGAALGALIGSAVLAASKAKEGLLGGLIVGMLVGGLMGASAQPVERVLALRFDPAMGHWQVYDGPLLRWAKRTLHPAVHPAA